MPRVKRLKGPTRPVQDLASRAQVLASLDAVDLVVPFDEDTPIDLISRLRPDVLVKGADYQAHEVVGADVVTEYGGRLLLVELVQRPFDDKHHQARCEHDQGLTPS